jgi:hypothetical protein
MRQRWRRRWHRLVRERRTQQRERKRGTLLSQHPLSHAATLPIVSLSLPLMRTHTFAHSPLAPHLTLVASLSSCSLAELAAVEIDAADVALIQAELALDAKRAERVLREAGGDVVAAMRAVLAA